MQKKVFMLALLSCFTQAVLAQDPLANAVSSSGEPEKQWAYLDSVLLARKAQCDCSLANLKKPKEVISFVGAGVGTIAASAGGIMEGAISDSSDIKKALGYAVYSTSAASSSMMMVVNMVIPKKKVEKKEKACAEIHEVYEAFTNAKPNFADAADFESKKAEFTEKAEKIGEMKCSCSQKQLEEKYGYPATTTTNTNNE